jgi:ATP-dependent DNA helicase RecG
MTLYGDLDVSIIDELPADRKPVRTAVRFESKIDKVWDFVRLEVQEGRQVYIVYPLVERSEKLELKSAVEHFEYLSASVFPDLRLGLLHGQMFWYEKEDAMRDFLARKVDIMIATTVIEVGIDVPNASVMVIENAERFGLSQLHQLRGRVGRGNAQSYCILMAKDHFRFHLMPGMTQNEARQERKAVIRRLQAMVETSDGFKISEIDLELRGPGDLVGTRQSGLPEFRHANLVTDGPIIAMAREAAFALVDADPELALPEHEQIREVFHAASKRQTQYADVG